MKLLAYAWLCVAVLLSSACGGGGSDNVAANNAKCSDFRYQEDAQAYFRTHSARQLDGDNDGIACESLPQRPSIPTPPTPPTSSSPQGFWSGTTSSGYSLTVVVLENNQVWGVYGIGNIAYGAFQGNGTATSTALSGPIYDYNLTTLTRNVASLSASYTARNALNGLVTQGSSSINFSTGYDSRYDLPALRADAAGIWAFNARSGAGTTSNTVTVTTAGVVTGANTSCTYAGTVTPRPSGKNVFDLALTFSGTACEFNGQTLRGVAVVRRQGVIRNFLVAALTSDRTNGFVAIAEQ